MESLVPTIAIFAIPVIFAITLHEAAHGYVARHFGDVTAWRLGRISLNPLRHIDIVGTIVVPLVILLSTKGSFVFGWAKPVPVDFGALRNPKRDMRWVAAAGPGANLLMALIWAAGVKLSSISGQPDGSFLLEVARAGVITNILFMVFNLLPILPLDGGRVVCSLLPNQLAYRFSKLERYGFPILIGLLLLSQVGFNVLGWVLAPLILITLRLLSGLFQVPVY
jgi:Zn-dependent protease